MGHDGETGKEKGSRGHNRWQSLALTEAGHDVIIASSGTHTVHRQQFEFIDACPCLRLNALSCSSLSTDRVKHRIAVTSVAVSNMPIQYQ